MNMSVKDGHNSCKHDGRTKSIERKVDCLATNSESQLVTNKVGNQVCRSSLFLKDTLIQLNVDCEGYSGEKN